jgi:predicted small secreted protein
MNKLMILAAALGVVTTTGACKAQKQYECIIRDARTGEVIRRVKVVYKSECQVYLLNP